MIRRADDARKLTNWIKDQTNETRYDDCIMWIREKPMTRADFDDILGVDQKFHEDFVRVQTMINYCYTKMDDAIFSMYPDDLYQQVLQGKEIDDADERFEKMLRKLLDNNWPPIRSMKKKKIYTVPTRAEWASQIVRDMYYSIQTEYKWAKRIILPQLPVHKEVKAICVHRIKELEIILNKMGRFR